MSKPDILQYLNRANRISKGIQVAAQRSVQAITYNQLKQYSVVIQQFSSGPVSLNARYIYMCMTTQITKEYDPKIVCNSNVVSCGPKPCFESMNDFQTEPVDSSIAHRFLFCLHVNASLLSEHNNQHCGNVHKLFQLLAGCWKRSTMSQ